MLVHEHIEFNFSWQLDCHLTSHNIQFFRVSHVNTSSFVILHNLQPSQTLLSIALL